MSEQLSMFDSQSDPVKELPEVKKQIPPEAEKTEYEALDKQLADLLQELNVFKDKDSDLQKAQNKIIKHCTLEISKHTREGQIAIPISEEHQAVLLQTNVAGEAGDYKPLIIDQGYLYLRRYWQYQNQLAKQIRARMTVDQEADEGNDSNSEAKDEVEVHDSWVQQRLNEFFPEINNNVNNPNNVYKSEINWQRRAVELALKHQFLIVSGGPGTGKTTTITRLLALLIEQHHFQCRKSKYEVAPKVR